jgi:D-galactose 1-dehydrogenase
LTTSAATGPIRIGVVGIGKIARDQHLPVIAANPDFKLIAVASRHASVDHVPQYSTVEDMLAGEPTLDAVAFCTPPQGRHAQAAAALNAGKHVLLEKPPGATLSEVADLRALAEGTGRSLFATWHSRFAPAVEAARAWIAERRVRGVRIEWREDVRHWHPGQAWIWQAGGLGVFDPGINALSIATHILPRPFFMTEGELRFPENRDAPISAELEFADGAGAPIVVSFDWLQTGPQTWDIRVETEDGVLVLSKGGAEMSIDQRTVASASDADLYGEYTGIYRRFSTLIAQGRSDVDISPLRHVADAFLRGRHVRVDAFHD